jgi:hypothetical protein
VGVSFDCPCGCVSECFVPFQTALDGSPGVYGLKGWDRTGDTFETLTLRPSILRTGGCPNKWHGFITDGAISTC